MITFFIRIGGWGTSMTREEYAAEVVARIRDAVTVPVKPVVTGDWTPQPNDCHNNVDAWVRANPGLTAVRGWVIDSNCTLAAHSVVRDANEQLLVKISRPSTAKACPGVLLNTWGVRSPFDR
jgi:hypothetical protein